MTDKRKYEDIFKCHYRVLVAFASAHYVSRDEAEDVVQDVFIKMWDRNDLFNISDEKLKNYLYSAVRNSSIDLLRNKKRKGGDMIEVNDNLTDDDNSEKKMINFEEEVSKSEMLRSVYMAVEALPKQCREILKKVYFEQKSYAMVAQEMNLSLNTVKVQMYRAHTKLREITLLLILYLIFAKYL